MGLLGGILVLVGIILIGVGTQAKRERAEEQRIGLPAAKGLSAVPFYVMGAVAIIAGVLLVTGIWRVS